MMLLAVGCNFRNTPVALRERLAFTEAQLPAVLAELGNRFACESVVLGTCNRVEIYLARLADDPPAEPGRAFPDREQIVQFLAECHHLDAAELRPQLYEHRAGDAVRHLFRVVASLDSLIVGEGQIAGQVKKAYELAQHHAAVGPILHGVFQHARLVAKRVRSETGIAQGRVSVSSVAVDYVRQVFEHFGDKTILVIGAGKMGELTLTHLRELRPHRILVTNRSEDKARAVASGCGGEVIAWNKLDGALAQADIVLSTTGAPEPIVTIERYQAIRARRPGGPVVILDIAVPRDFDPRIHDGEQTCLFNIDDLKRIREQTLEGRQQHVPPAESIVEQEQRRFLQDWTRRRNGPIIARLSREFEAMRLAIVRPLFERLNGRLTEDERADIEGAFRLQQNQFLHVLITALNEEHPEGSRHSLLETIRKLFGG